VGDLLRESFPATLELALAATVIALLLAVPAGIYAAVHRDGVLDRLLMAGALIGQAMPIFWLGIMLITLFSVKLGWLPTSGRGSLAQLIMPSVTLSTYVMALLARLTRSNMLDVLREQYVRTARAKGLRETVIVHKHALMSAALPIVTVLGLQVGALLSGAVVTETVFNWPGIGTLALRAIQQRDYPVVQGVVLVSAALFVLINGMVDLAYRYLDPRVRLT
jgi:ABC-type dipeptide/oligopeptide/nickel transport system permease component